MESTKRNELSAENGKHKLEAWWLESGIRCYRFSQGKREIVFKDVNGLLNAIGCVHKGMIVCLEGGKVKGVLRLF